MNRRLPWGKLALMALAGLLLFWVFRNISPNQVLRTLRVLDGRDLLLLALVNAVVFISFGIRWWLLLCALDQRVPFWRLLLYRLTSFAISYFTPGPHFGGEPYQVYATTQWHNVPTGRAIAAVALDKLLEMLVNFALLTAGVILLLGTRLGLAKGLEIQLVVSAVLLMALPVGLMIAQWQGRRPLTWLVIHIWRRRRKPSWFRPLRQSEDQASYIWREHPRIVALALLATLVSLGGMVLEFWLLASVLELPLPFLDVLSAFVVVRIAILLPMPAGLGALEAGLAMAMVSLGLDPSAGVSMALVIRARDVLLGVSGLAVGGVHVFERAAAGEKSVERVDFE